jgi:diguanylate cyclase (GGDEF)-like protein
MPSLSQRATTALVYACAFFAVVITVVGGVGVIGVRSAIDSGNSISRDELQTSTVTARVGQRIDDAYAAAEGSLLTGDSKLRSSLLSTLYTEILPKVETELSNLQRLHADDAVREQRGIVVLEQQWSAVRALLNPVELESGAQTARAEQLTAVYDPVNEHVDALIERERVDADQGGAQASAQGARTMWLIGGTVGLGLIAALALASAGRRRIRKAFEPERDQVDFGSTLQIADDEAEAHQLLQRHLERTLANTTAVVLNRNNSADRLEAVTPMPPGSTLVASLAKAEPRACLAVRSGRTHTEDEARPGLLACSVCSGCPGNSSCTPLTVGGEVIGSVLLNRPAPFNEAENVRIRDSVSQAAPVLANLRNLAIAEIRAATDSLTGLSNKRAVTDTLTRMFAQASRSGSSLSLVLLDLDHFKDVNDRHGHPVGDQALANVGAVLRSVLRAGDFAGRNGGEEFALLLPDTDIAAAQEIAQRVRAAIADISLPGVDLVLTASLGIATYPEHANTLERLERLADAALYLAKRAGRNRCEVANPNSEPMAAELTSTNGHHVVG